MNKDALLALLSVTLEAAFAVQSIRRDAGGRDCTLSIDRIWERICKKQDIYNAHIISISFSSVSIL